MILSKILLPCFLIIIIIVIIVIILFIIVKRRREDMIPTPTPVTLDKPEEIKCQKIRWAVLLTTCVFPSNSTNTGNNNSEARKNLYVVQIQRWVDNTTLPIFVVDTSGYTFDEIPKSDRLYIMSYKTQHPISTSTEGEKIGLMYAMSQMSQMCQMSQISECNFTHILKVTGRYYLEGIENKLEKANTKEYDLFLQIHRNNEGRWQNSEYYGIRRDLMEDFITSIQGRLMEHCLYDFSSRVRFDFLGPFPNQIARGGDLLVIDPL